jgi:hypothetical protein
LTTASVLAETATVWARDIRINPVQMEGRILVSFTARDAWTLPVRDALKTGTSMMFTYDVELRRPGTIRLFDSVLARATVTSTAKFNTLSGEYQVQRLRQGTIVESTRVRRDTDVRDWLTTIDQVSLDPVTPLEPNTDYAVHVGLTISPRLEFSLWSLWPFARSDEAGRAIFTYIR